MIKFIVKKEQLLSKLNSNISVIGEIPFVKDEETQKPKLNLNNTRSVLLESMRMLLSNLRFTVAMIIYPLKNVDNFIYILNKRRRKNSCFNNATNILCGESDKRVIILGSDLRNPQIHKFFGISKDNLEISGEFILFQK